MIPLSCKTHYTLLKGLSTADDIAERCKELGFNSCAVTDSNSISGAVSYAATLSKAGIKPILGCEFSLNYNGREVNQTLIARTKEGWSNIVELVSRAHDDKNYVNRPIITSQDLKECGKGIITYTGNIVNGLETSEAERVVSDLRESVDEVLIGIYQDMFVEDRRLLARITKCEPVGIHTSYYSKPDEAKYHRLMLCTGMKTTLKNIEQDISRGLAVENHPFFAVNDYYIKSPAELDFNDRELENSDYVASICENISLTDKPRLPEYKWTNGLTEAEYLTQLCREGWKLRNKNKDWGNEYVDRVKYELSVVQSYDVLNRYFLIVQDYVRWAKNQGWLVGNARGSSAGSLVSYLLQIIETNPIPYHLIFERFYNAGRNTAEKVSLPDIDIDFPTDKREKVVDYMKEKHGSDCVGHMATFGKLKGRSSIREVLRVNSVCDMDEMNKISKRIPQDFEIADDMEEQQEDSVLRFTFRNMPKLLAEYCTMNDNGELEGEYAEYFNQAIRLEGLNRNQGKHASGVVVYDKPIRKVAPMIRDTKGNRIIGYDMKNCEEAGLVKFDILGLNLLNKLQGVNNLLRYGRMMV